MVGNGEEERERAGAEGRGQRQGLQRLGELVGSPRYNNEQYREHGPLPDGYAGQRDRREHQGGRCPPPEHGSPRRRPGASSARKNSSEEKSGHSVFVT